MRKLDIFIVRFLPLVMFINIIIVVCNAWMAVAMEYNNFFFGNSFLFSLSLFLISLSNKRYHCIWNRAMYIELMIIPLINFIDMKWCVFEETIAMLLFISATLIVTLLATLYLAIRHFVKPRIKKIKDGR